MWKRKSIYRRDSYMHRSQNKNIHEYLSFSTRKSFNNHHTNTKENKSLCRIDRKYFFCSSFRIRWSLFLFLVIEEISDGRSRSLENQCSSFVVILFFSNNSRRTLKSTRTKENKHNRKRFSEAFFRLCDNMSCSLVQQIEQRGFQWKREKENVSLRGTLSKKKNHNQLKRKSKKKKF